MARALQTNRSEQEHEMKTKTGVRAAGGAVHVFKPRS
jgi:hypothetical protein